MPTTSGQTGPARDWLQAPAVAGVNAGQRAGQATFDAAGGQPRKPPEGQRPSSRLSGATDRSRTRPET